MTLDRNMPVKRKSKPSAGLKRVAQSGEMTGSVRKTTTVFTAPLTKKLSLSVGTKRRVHMHSATKPVRKMTGFLKLLSEEQRNDLLSYDGDDTVGVAEV